MGVDDVEAAHLQQHGQAAEPVDVELAGPAQADVAHAGVGQRLRGLRRGEAGGADPRLEAVAREVAHQPEGEPLGPALIGG